MNLKHKSVLMLVLLLVILTTKSSLVTATTINNTSDYEINNVNADMYDEIIITKGYLLTYDDFTQIKDYLIVLNRSVSDDEAKELIVQKILLKERLSDPLITPSFTIWGMNLNAAELQMVVLHHIAAITVYADAQTALTTAENVYQSNTLYQGNGDAFRHAYWNALMTSHLGSNLAYGFATAHEAETPDGVDKTMDLNNNAKGRTIGGFGVSDSQLQSICESYVSSSQLFRIVNGQLYQQIQAEENNNIR